MMTAPSPHAIALLAVTIGTFYLYTRSWIRMELVSLLLLLSLLVLFYLFPYSNEAVRFTDAEVFEAFGHPALVAICCLMVLGRGLTMTAAIEPAVRLLGRVWDFSRPLGLLFTLVVAGITSAFVNDTPVMVLMLPLLLGLARRTGFPASKTLLPVNFAILAGGMLTSIGTSTNILVLNIATELGMHPVGVFDFTSTAIVAFAIALPYLWLIAPRLLPDNGKTLETSIRKFEARVKVSDADGKLVGQDAARLARTLGRELPARTVMRGGQDVPLDTAGPLALGDSLLLHDTAEGLQQIATAFAIDLFDKQGLGQFAVSEDAGADTQLAEVVIGNDSELSGRTLKSVRFAEQHQIVVVGLNRGTEGLLHSLAEVADTPLSAGDVLLVQGPSDTVEKLRSAPGLLLLDVSVAIPRSPLAPVALIIMGVVVALAATKLLPIHVAAFVGVVAMLITGCVRLDGVGRALSMEVVLLVASSVALGQSLVATGAAAWIASGVAYMVQQVPPSAQLAVFMAFAALLTNFVSNSAAAAVGTPIAIATAVQLGHPMEPFVLAILFGANLSYATPMAYQTNLLVMRAAGYRFVDFVRVGLPLVLLMLTSLSILLSRRYGL